MYNTTVRTTRNSTASLAARTAVVVIGLFVGTGSNAATMVSERTNAYTKSKTCSQIFSHTQVASKSDGVDIRNPMQHLENIKAVFSFPMSETAAIFGVTRQSIYKWIAGTSTPEQENLAKIAELSRIADTFKSAGTDRPGELMRMKVFSGKSVLDLIRNGEDYTTHLPILIEESRAMDLAYDNSNIAKLPQGRTDDWKSTISIPFSDDV